MPPPSVRRSISTVDPTIPSRLLKLYIIAPKWLAATPDEEAAVEPLVKSKGKFTGVLKGGVGKSTGGEKFGLNW